MRLAVLQRVCPPYRIALFKALFAVKDMECRLFIGDDLPNTKVKSASSLEGLDVERLKTRFLKFGRRTLPWHVGLVDALRKFDPDVILCEGESHFLGYLQAIYYQAWHKQNVALMHWCFTALPGEPRNRRDTAARIKIYFRRYFDAFVSYSSFSKDCLTQQGQPAEKIFVATNVGEVTKFLGLAETLAHTKSAARERLRLPERFTVLYAGALDENKRPEILLELARVSNAEAYSFVLLGSGPELEPLRRRAAAERLANVFLPGRVNDLALYYRAADVLIVPGRGGIVMSEALAAGLPVIVHQADGTEYDLIEPGVTGLRVDRCSVEFFAQAIESLRSQPALAARMGAAGQRRMANTYNEQTMARTILSASQYAVEGRAYRLSDKAV
jgi:glycosyltransferase involved in cell wall biosynthesis